MIDSERIHKEAMELAEEASLERIKGNLTRALELIKQALAKEKDAAEKIASDISMEPTRSVLHRSAASLALECGDIREAEKLISIALSGNPPDEIAGELRDLLEQVNLQRHLELRGIVLAPYEFQFSITGDAVGYGIARSEVFIGRIQDLEKLIYRTAERQSGRPFREKGRREIRIARDVEVFLSVPRAASFAVSFMLGQEATLPGLGHAEIVIKELLDCLELVNASKVKELRSLIPDPSYYRNFYALARRIAPDGQAVRSVGFTAIQDGKERRLLLSVPQAKLQAIPLDLEEKGKKTEVEGTLKFADAMKEEKNEIRLIDRQGNKHYLHVPPGMMDDIVRPLWDCKVFVSGIKRGKWILLKDIRKVED
jgi:tetratricopeptide (TPR) repeat protein